MRDAWTDERLDDLANRVDRGFDRAHADVRDLGDQTNRGFDRVDTELRELRSEMNSRFADVDTEFRDLRSVMNARFDAVQRTMVLGFATIVASVLGAAIAL